MGIKDTLKQLLFDRGVEVAALARETGIARQAIADILSGKTRRPQNKTVKRLAEYFDITPNYLLHEAEPRAEVWEYKTIDAILWTKGNNIGEEVQNAGRDGWELVAIVDSGWRPPGTFRAICIFKRRTPED